MSLSSEPIEAPKPQGRSRVSNGSSHFIGDVDGRGELARRVRDLHADLVAHLGGRPSATEDMIARRAATLAAWCETQDATLAAGADFDHAAYSTAANTLRRLLADLGLERRARDVTPSLASYLEAKNRERSE